MLPKKRFIRCLLPFWLFILGASAGWSQKTVFWRVTDTASGVTSYLLGTNHIVGASFLASFPEIDAALSACDVALFESLDSSGIQFAERIAARAPSDSLKRLLTRREYRYLRSICQKYGLTRAELNRLTALEFTLKLLQIAKIHVCDTYKSGDAPVQLDSYLEQKARDRRKILRGLEEATDQTAALDAYQTQYGISWASQREDIKAVLAMHRQKTYNEDLCATETDYVRLNLPYFLEEDCPDDPLLGPRNAAWLTQLEPLLRRSKCFVAVGFAHLRYDCGLIQRLKALGFAVEPVIRLN